MQDISKLPTTELVGIYNRLNPGHPLVAWKGKKSVLLERIHKLAESQGVEVLGTSTVDTKTKAAEKTVTKVVKPKVTGNSPDRTIRAAALELLCHVDHYEDRGEKSGPDNVVMADHTGARSVGIPYDKIIRDIKAEFPDCETTVACLRWYSVKIRVEEQDYEGWKLPQRRPRVKPRSA